MKKNAIVALGLVLGLGVAQASAPTGNYIVYECPFCKAKMHEDEWASYNTFGGLAWSDAFLMAPMAPSDDLVTRCWKCRKLFSKWGVKPTTVGFDAIPFEDPTNPQVVWIGDYDAVKEVLANEGGKDQNLEFGLRLRMLWAVNHRVRIETVGDKALKIVWRDGLKAVTVPAAEQEENLRRLSAMTNAPLWLRAEILREAGSFDAAKGLLAQFSRSELEEFESSVFLRDLFRRIERRDPMVFQNYGGEEKKEKEAFLWYQKAAVLGNLDAECLLGDCLADGKGVASNATEAVKWYHKAAERGDATAQSRLGWCYDNGLGVKTNVSEAAKWYRKAAEQGDPSAQNNLASDYFGGIGVEKDVVKAVKWGSLAAAQGYVEAQKGVGVCYYAGIGVEKNDVEAVKWFRLAAEQGDAEAQAVLGAFYDTGIGVEKNKAEAEKWFRKAVKEGELHASELLETASKLLAQPWRTR